MPNDDIDQAARAERLGDAAETRQEATACYRAAQMLLLPVGVVWTDREAYDRRQAAFERIQEKLYSLDRREFSPPAAVSAGSRAAVPTAVPAASLAPVSPIPSVPPAADLTVWDFKPGLVVRIGRTFSDFDGQEIREGEVLHFAGKSYFPYDGGHTLVFAEKTIRLAELIEEHAAIVKNAGNAWFQQLS